MLNIIPLCIYLDFRHSDFRHSDKCPAGDKAAIRSEIILFSFFIFILFIGGEAAIHPFYRLRSNHLRCAAATLSFLSLRSSYAQKSVQTFKNWFTRHKQ
jgi:hypothetical protein